MSIPLVPFFIDGKWSRPTGLATTPVFNPSTGEVIAAAPVGGSAEVGAAVAAAQAAFPEWMETPFGDRARVLLNYRELLRAHFDEIAALISREHGKTRGEARGDLQRGVEVVEFAAGISTLLFGDTLENVARGIDCETLRQPLGVCAGITPFNFPAMVPMWMFPVALACGNTFVLKPSEKVPLTAVRLVELLAEAGLPAGVLNLVHGGRECVDALLIHPQVRAVSFVGSTAVARHIYETGTKHGKRVQAAGGAKNFILIMPDADVTKTVEGVTGASFGCAGERCMAGSTALLVGGAARTVLPTLVAATKAIQVGRTDLEEQPAMGPVISAPHRDRVLSLLAQGEAQGAKVLADGRGVQVTGAPGGFYLGGSVVEPSDPTTNILMHEEVFGPVLSVLRMDDLDAAIELANRSPYGNGAALFTRSGKAAREFKHRMRTGMIGINIGVPAAMAPFPFSGWNESFFGDLHVQGREGVLFYTQQKVCTTRWFAEGEGDIWRK
ncbi:MAG TPA: CoA-acylating methylmalonate-semialdehyde dehydrogenase [Candidatus Didemnitutus sp.]|nr:CoA-acylating methylmalonate-semialdehyde dehydrogenase [Candidatus Didemnitutus sp.]